MIIDVFRGLFRSYASDLLPEALPQIHCYCFSKAEDYIADAIDVRKFP